MSADDKASFVYDPDTIAGGMEVLRAVPGDQFIDRKDGLRPVACAQEIQRVLRYGWNRVDGKFYVFDHGRWVDGQPVVEEAIVALLGDRYRASYEGTITKVMRTLPRVQQVSGEAVGPERWINVRNGLIEWHTGERFDHVPDACGVTQLPVEWHPDATCPAFEKFLAEVLPGDCLEVTEQFPVGFIWEVLGYAIYSGNPMHKAFMLIGSGGNGKSRFLHVLEALAGSRNVSSVGLHELVGNRFRAATLYGRLLNVAGDLDPKWMEDTATFKKITGGDSVQAEHKFGHPFDFVPWATPFYSVNKAFGSADTSEGYWRRWIVLPFPYNHRDSPRTADEIDAANEADLPGILTRAVAGLAVLMDRGKFIEPASVRAAKEEFRAQADRVRGWLQDKAELGPDYWMARTVLYQSFDQFTEDEGGRPLRSSEFYARLRQDTRLVPAKRKGTDGFRGIRLRL